MDSSNSGVSQHKRDHDKTPPNHPKQPNKLQYNEQINKIRENIRRAETDRGSLGHQISGKKEVLRKIREEREKIAKDKAGIFDSVESKNKEVRSQGDLVQKLRSGVSFIRREEIEEQVRRLETQLARSNLKLPEERRIVTEIDRLKRSKKTLVEFDREKQELERMRREQHVARDKRDQWFKRSKEAKSQVIYSLKFYSKNVHKSAEMKHTNEIVINSD